MLKISEWNIVVKYGNEVCNKLKECGYNARIKPYTMYDGRKGLYVQLLDYTGILYKQYATGICNSVEGFKKSLDVQAKRIKSEC